MFKLPIVMTLHFIADFILQSRDMGKRKSENMLVLAQHLIIQFVVLFIGVYLTFMFKQPLMAFKASFVNALVHGVIDWNIWRLYKGYVLYRVKNKTLIVSDTTKFEYWNDHAFYMTIGLDQLLHCLTLIFIYGDMYA